MAYVANDPNQQNPQNQNPLGQQAPVTTSAAPGSTGGGTGGAAAQPSNQNPGQPFTNLSAYLTANAPQIGQMATNVASDLNAKYGQVQNQIQSGVQNFNQQVQGGYTPANADVVTQATANPVQFVQDQNNVKAFQSQLNDQYTGPANFETTPDYAGINQSVTTAAPNASIGNDVGALQSYLRGTGNNPTEGSNLLDTVLLRGNPDALKTIQSAATPFSQLPDYLTSQVTTADQAVPAAQQSAQQAAQTAKNAFLGSSGIAPSFMNSLIDHLNSSNAARDSFNASINQNQTAAQSAEAALRNALATDTAKYAGNVQNLAGNPTTSQQMLTKIAGLMDPTSYLSQLTPFESAKPLTNAGTLANTSTTQDYAEDAALQKLLGDQYTPVLNPGDISQAGTFSVPTLSGALPDTSGQVQYMNDVSSLYAIPGLTNANTPGGWQGATPSQIAQSVLNTQPGQGVTFDDSTKQALQRIIANQYAGR